MPKIHSVDPQTAFQWLKNGEAILIDVREIAEYNAESIKDSYNMPLSKLSVKEINLPPHKGKKMIFSCRSGRRSQLVCEKLLSQNIPYDLWNLEGGILEWKNQNLPTLTSSQKGIIPLDRQVHIAAGIMILVGMLLGFFFAPLFYLLPTFVGLGLLNNGLTGWCGMGLLLAKMPWNQK